MAIAEFETARVFARSWDRNHSLELLEMGVDLEVRETFESAMAFGAETLRALGFDADEVEATVTDVRRRDADRLSLQRRRAGPGADGRGRVEPEPLVPPRNAA